MTDEVERDEVLARVREAAVEVLDCDPARVSLDSTLRGVLDAGPIEIFEIAAVLERDFGVVIEDHEVYGLTDVRDLVDLVAHKRAG